LAFFKPSKLCVANDRLFVADTNNHRVVLVNLKTQEWCEVILEGLQGPAEGGVDEDRVLSAEPIVVTPGMDVALLLDVKLLGSAHLNAEAPWSVRVSADGATLAQRTGKSAELPLRVTVPGAAVRAGVAWSVEAAFASCTDDGGLCTPHRVAWTAPVRAGRSDCPIVLRVEL
jgi:hypothetical protein